MKRPMGRCPSPYGVLSIALWGVARPPMGRLLLPNEKGLFSGRHADNHKSLE